MRKLWMMAAVGGLLAGPAAAQSLNDAGRLLQQVLPGQQQPQGQSDRDRAIYEQGRRDAEQSRRQEDGTGDGRRSNDRRRADDRPRYDRDGDRRRGDQDRPYDDDSRTQRQPSGRYQPLDNR